MKLFVSQEKESWLILSKNKLDTIMEFRGFPGHLASKQYCGGSFGGGSSGGGGSGGSY
ncbi:hypothetical protein [Leptospira levettii]|uniref:hypothetical protein n=1 Tax=Leptospira levettii TaxID=2023178 RepID=UPI001438543F|nr:hypothetical protein [Leptospira levettii]